MDKRRRRRIDKGREGENDYRRRASPIGDAQALSVFNREL